MEICWPPDINCYCEFCPPWLLLALGDMVALAPAPLAPAVPIYYWLWRTPERGGLLFIKSAAAPPPAAVLLPPPPLFVIGCCPCVVLSGVAPAWWKLVPFAPMMALRGLLEYGWVLLLMLLVLMLSGGGVVAFGVLPCPVYCGYY